jgi:hypothetical protein
MRSSFHSSVWGLGLVLSSAAWPISTGCKSDAAPGTPSGSGGSAGSGEAGAPTETGTSGGGGEEPAGSGGLPAGAAGGAPEGGSGDEPCTECVTGCTADDQTACFDDGMVCVDGETDCADPDSIATCDEAADMPDRDDMGPIVGAQSFITRDDQSDGQCELGIGADLLPDGAEFAYLVRTQFVDADGDGPAAAQLPPGLLDAIRIESNAPDVATHVYASGLEGGGASGYFNIMLCLEEEYDVGDLTVAIALSDDADHFSNAACVTYEGGMNGARP